LIKFDKFKTCYKFIMKFPKALGLGHTSYLSSSPSFSNLLPPILETSQIRHLIYIHHWLTLVLRLKDEEMGFQWRRMIWPKHFLPLFKPMGQLSKAFLIYIRHMPFRLYQHYKRKSQGLYLFHLLSHRI